MDQAMALVEHLRRRGGLADRASLVALTGRAALDSAVRGGEVVRVGHGRYALAVADAAVRAAHALTGVVSHRSAALHWGWELKTVPERPDVTVPRGRKVPVSRRDGVTLHRADLAPGETIGPFTSPRRTLVDCLRSLPFDEALAVADSALRRGSLDEAKLMEVAASVQGPGAATARRVAREASGRAANPFESALRAISLDVPGLRLAPQVTITALDFEVTPDLVDVARRVAVEADSFAWHGDRAALRTDTRRYNNLVTRGWLVLRFSWEDVMHDPVYVRCTLERLAALVNGLPEEGQRRRSSQTKS